MPMSSSSWTTKERLCRSGLKETHYPRFFVIHIHGGPGGDALTSFNIVGKAFTDPLEKRYANVYYDQRASGSSQGHFQADLFNEDQYAEDLYKLVLLLKAKYGSNIQIFLLGTSWGGRLGTRYLLNDTYQQEISGWISAAGAQDLVLSANSGKDLLEHYAQSYIGVGRDKKKWLEILEWAQQTDTIINFDQWGDQNSLGWKAMKLVDDSLSHETPIALGKVLKTAFFSPVKHRLVASDVFFS